VSGLVLPPDIVDASVGPCPAAIDARWLMAYAAGLGERDPRYYDTLASGGPVAHPLFAVCYEWPAAVALRAKTVPDRAARLGVHATHQLIVHRLPRADDRLAITGRVVAVARRRAGALVVLRFDTVDALGTPVTTTIYGSVYRGVSCAEAGVVGPPPPPPPGPAQWHATVPVAASAAHVYTETARIWNPIHTDVAVARAAGLPGIILHGTATLALAVSQVISHELGGDPCRVRTVSCRFTGMVTMPAILTVRGGARRDDAIGFDVLDASGGAVLSGGVVRA
jgi:acyl dehydratase